jgi:hypothetical protein
MADWADMVKATVKALPLTVTGHSRRCPSTRLVGVKMAENGIYTKRKQLGGDFSIYS